MTIGFCDSGSGGLTVLARCFKVVPDRSYLYIGDHAHAPYGNKPAEEIVAATKGLLNALFGRGCRLVIVACNTASAVAIRPIQEDWLPEAWPGRRALGIHVPTVEAVTGLKWNRDAPGISRSHPRSVGVFATRATVASATYTRQINRRAPECRVTEVACPGLAMAIETGMTEANLQEMVAGFVAEMLEKAGGPPERVILGCTHYPLIEPQFARALPEGVRILSQPRIVAAALWDYLDRHPELAPPEEAPAPPLYFTTGDPKALLHLDRFFEGTAPRFQRLG